MKYAQKVKKRYLTILNDMAKNRDSYVKRDCFKFCVNTKN